MKNPLLLLSFAALTAVSCPLVAQDDGEATGRAKPPIKVEMEKLDEALEAIEAFLEEPAGEPPLAPAAAAQQALQAAKQHAPRTTWQQPEAERAAFVVAYRLMVNDTMRRLVDLEDALLQQDWAKAKTVAASLGQLKKEGHDRFKKRRRTE